MDAVPPGLESKPAGDGGGGRHRAEGLAAFDELHRAGLEGVEVLADAGRKMRSKHSSPVRPDHRPVARPV